MTARPRFKQNDRVEYLGAPYEGRIAAGIGHLKGSTATVQYLVHDPENGWRYGLIFEDGTKWQVGQASIRRVS